MRMYDIINKKKRGLELSEDEIRYFVFGYTKGEIPDYQVSALLMAICLNGCSEKETVYLTGAITDSGDVVDLSQFENKTVDKHSTGGVGDKTTLIVTPICASLGGKVAKMSGRGLGHTGGTVDKLESIPGYTVELTPERFLKQVSEIGLAVTSQSGNLAPADKKIYALRDVTATVDSIPLITSSIMGKKLASGSHSIVLDVKCGSGSFMKTPEEAEKLARLMVKIGYARGKQVSALITDMDKPLGHAVGNILEVKEAVEVLRGKGDSDLVEVSLALATEMVHLSLNIPREEAKIKCEETLKNGSAYRKFLEWIGAQGGDKKYIENLELFDTSPYQSKIIAEKDGYISSMNTEKIGLASVALGGGRIKKEDKIDYTAGIIIAKKTGDRVSCGDVLATLYSSDKEKLKSGEEIYLTAIEISDKKPETKPDIFKLIEK